MRPLRKRLGVVVLTPWGQQSWTWTIRGTKLKLLGEFWTRRVWMELTSENMKFLFDQVSAEVGLEASAESPTKARSSGSDASGGSEDEDSATLCPPAKRSKGITWVSTRKTWVVRYKDPEGRCHQKRFRVSPQAGDDCEKARDDALKLAEEWLEGHHEAVGLGC